MIFIPAVRISFRALWKAKVRAALTVLGILIGVAAVVIVVALGNAVRGQVMDQIATLGANTIYIFPQDTRSSGARTQPRPRLTEEDAAAILQEATSVAAITPQSTTRAQLVVGDRNYSTSVLGVGDSFFTVMGFDVSEGSTFSATDFRTKAKVVILGETVKRELFGSGAPIGEYIRIGKYPFRVIGVLKSKGQSPFGEDQDDRILTPIGTFRARLLPSPPGRVQMLIAQASSDLTVDQAVRQIEQLLRQRHKIDPEDEPDFLVRTQAEIRKANEESFAMLTGILSAIAGISLIVGGIGVMNVMLVSVTERTREIGIRLAIGASEADILLQFLVEAVVLSMIGGILGLALGLGVNGALAYAIGWTFSVPPAAVILAVATSATVGIVFGFLPARRAAKLDPIDALRHE
ncbi:MAG: FtsX-like permease family protein [Polyangiaceae bacterium]|nr:FtsX-like permease family protein [Polyangiaceae bacterium]